MAKCRHCGTKDNLKKTTEPIERRGKIVNYRKVSVCPECLQRHYPEYATENTDGDVEPKSYTIMIRGKPSSIRGRKVK